MTDIGDFDDSWENIYLKEKMLNRYPYSLVVSSIFRYFGDVLKC